MDVLPAEMPQMMGGYTAAETMVVPTIITGTITSIISVAKCNVLRNFLGEASATSSSSNQDNIALPPSTKSLVNPPPPAMSAVTADTIVTHCSSKNSPLITVVPTSSGAGPSGGVPTNPGGGLAASSGESMVQVHSTESQMSTGGQRVALVTSQTNPNKISIVPADQIPTSTKTTQPPISSIVTSSSTSTSSAASKVANNPVVSDENSINEANRMPKPQQVRTDLKKWGK